MPEPRKTIGESLFEKLAGQFVDGVPVDSEPMESRRAKSIADHLWRMFNTRQGSIPHLDDYGLPDITEIYRKLPGSLKDLEQTLLKMTTKYEPRLERVRVKPIATDVMEFRLAFEMSAYIKGGGPIQFQTSFMSNGETKVDAAKPRS